MKKKVLKVGLFCVLALFFVFYSFYLTQLYSYDEIWNYGFASNITNGLVPYRDFNMIIGPLFIYILAFIFSLFGKSLFIYHIVIGIMVVLITYLASRKIKFYSILIYIALLIYAGNGYNTSTLLWLFVLLGLLDKEDDNYNDIVIPIIISLMVLTKQTLCLLVIPSFIYSKNKKKTILTYLVCFLLFVSYLVINNNFVYFVDYCILGMFDFAGNNGLVTPMYLFLEIIIIISLLVVLIRSKFRRKDIFYVLLYQVMAFPILEVYHFVLGWSAYIYVVFQSDKIKGIIKNYLFVFLVIGEIFLLFMTNNLSFVQMPSYYKHHSGDTFLRGRLIPEVTESYIGKIGEYIDEYPEHRVYILSGYSYLVKLYLDEPIDKFDLINNGNMGYNGASRYLEEIDNYCSDNKCLFIINDNDLKSEAYNQTNKEILEYVVLKNNKIYASSIFSVYVNESGVR